MFGPSLKSAVALLVLGISIISSAAPVQSPSSTKDAQATSRLYILDQRGGRIITTKTDGTDMKVVTQGLRSAVDGIAVDKAAGFIYFSNMGSAIGMSASGSIQRVKLDGTGLTTLVAPGKTHTAKQLVLVNTGGQKKLYWGDREGMKVMRANVDGSDLEVVVNTANIKCQGSQACKHVVGVAVDTQNGWVYWTQKGGDSAGEGSIRRAPVNFKAGETADRRSDIQTLLTGLPEPIDMRWVAETGTLYWTDRGNIEGGNSVNRLQVGAAQSVVQGTARAQMLYTGLGAGIGLAIDVPGKTMWATDLRGQLWMSDMDGKQKKRIGQGLGILVGIDYAE